MTPAPTAADAAVIAAESAKTPVRNVVRFTTGLAHYVFDVELNDERRVVVRMGRPDDRATFDAAEYWSNLLRPLGVPLPELYGRGGYHRMPYLLLERLPGHDLQDQYSSLSGGEKHSLALKIVQIQRVVGALPAGAGYGFARRLDGPFSATTWPAVLHGLLARSRRQIILGGVVEADVVDRVERQVEDNARFGRVLPTPFLDDITTKNVIVHNGRLSGIVDVDALCFGDPLLTVALTQMALLSADRNTDYVDTWCALLELSAEQQHTLRIYTAIHCVGFLSEQGHAFNQDTPPPPDRIQVARLYQILDGLLMPE